MENLEFLKSNIKRTGFGDSVFAELENNVQSKVPEFDLKLARQIDNNNVSVDLHFKKATNSDMYFFNGYHMTIERGNQERVAQQFFINKGKGVSAKDAYTLLHGKPVRLDLTNAKGEDYKAWVQLDLKNKDDAGNYIVNRYNEGYGYDLRDAIAKFPVVQLDGAEREKDLITALERGGLEEVTIKTADKEQHVFIEANPQFKSINVYDENMKLMKHESLPKTQQQNQPGVSQKDNTALPKQKQSNPVVETKQPRKNRSVRIS